MIVAAWARTSLGRRIRGLASAGIDPREIGDPGAERGHATPIGGQHNRGRIALHRLRYDRENALLQRMVRSEIGFDRIAEMQAGREHPSVLAGAAILQGRCGHQPKRNASVFARIQRTCCPALQQPRIGADLVEHCRNGLLLTSFPIVRRTTKRQFGFGKTKPIRRATLDQRNGLKWFRGRSEIGETIGVAGRGDHTARTLDDRQRRLMLAFDMGAPRQGDVQWFRYAHGPDPRSC